MIVSLSGRSPLATLRRNGRRVRSGPLSVTYLPRVDRDEIRVAYAIGRSVGPAVRRNRVRRRLRHLLVDLDRCGLTPGPGDLLISVGPAAAERSSVELRGDLLRIVGRLGESGLS